MLNRRRFLKQVGATSSLAMASQVFGNNISRGISDRYGDILPTRPLGSTGEKVTIYCMGGYHVSVAKDKKEAQKIIERGMELGVRFYETAWMYTNGLSEELYGKYLVPDYRDKIFLATKNSGSNSNEAKKQLEDSLRRLKCDVIDLYYMHMIENPEDVNNRLSNGVLEVLLKAQEQGIVRYLGFTGHRHSSAFHRLIKEVSGKDPFVAVQLPINPVDAAKVDSFTNELIPCLQKKGYAIMAMKTLAQGRFFATAAPDGGEWKTSDPVVPNHLSLEEVFHFVLSQPITSLVSGTDKVELLEENVRVVKKFVTLSLEEQQIIVQKVSRFALVEGLEKYRPKPGTY